MVEPGNWIKVKSGPWEGWEAIVTDVTGDGDIVTRQPQDEEGNNFLVFEQDNVEVIQ